MQDSVMGLLPSCVSVCVCVQNWVATNQEQKEPHPTCCLCYLCSSKN